MRKGFKYSIIGFGGLFLLLGAALFFRTGIFLTLASLEEPPALADKNTVILGDREEWLDDYYSIEKIDDQTFALSEPRYFRDVYSYLLIGSEKALLIDSGSPHGNIAQAVRKLTKLPVWVIATHLHFDHVGNHDRFDQVLMPDINALRLSTRNDYFIPNSSQHLGAVEDFTIPGWQVSAWWHPEETFDLGGRVLSLLHTPGHTPDSISIWEKKRNRVFMGDYGGDGEIYAFMPNSSLGTYLQTTTLLIDQLPQNTVLFAAHGGSETQGLPTTGMTSLHQLQSGLSNMRDRLIDGQGFWPRSYEISNNTVILADWRAPGGMSWDF